jgi:uncharacterized protein YjbI with pentapeptide repeats
VRDEMGDETIWRRFRRKAAARGRTLVQPAPAHSGESEPDTKEAEALAAALNHSAERVQTLWFSFLTFMLYLAVATGTTTHRMLFLEEPLKLPVLNIPLPLLGFYILTPIIFVVFHFYMLLNLVLLARTAKSFEDALVRAFPEDGEGRETFRMRIENTLFVQLLVGGRLEREGINAKLLSLMALISLALAPVALLLMFEIKFLPYHSEAITWLHRGLLALDLALVWTLWPGYRSGWGVISRPKATWWLVVPGIGSAAALAYAVIVVTFPDEQMYLATYWLHGSTYLHHTWYALIAPVNTLDQHGEDLIDDAKLKQIIEKNESSADAQRWVSTLSLRDRDLTGANLRSADVRHVDFSQAILNRANLIYAWAKKARFDRAQLRGASLNDAQLQGAWLDGAQLQGACLNYAQLQGASLHHAQLQAASLDYAQLQGTWLNYAQLQGARLNYAQLQGASLHDAQLQAASLDYAQLQGAWLNHAQLQGARLDSAGLQGASLSGAGLQGASLSGAQLQGASLSGARLQGAELGDPPSSRPSVRTVEPGVSRNGPVFSGFGGASDASLRGGAQLQSASIVDVCVWRADARQAAWIDTRVARPEIALKADTVPQCGWTAAYFAELKKLIAEEVPEGAAKRAAMERIEQRLDPAKALEGEDEMAKIWAAREREAPIPEAYEKSLASQWHIIGCADEGAPYVLHALIVRLSRSDASPFSDRSDEAKALAAAFLNEGNCPSAHGLSEADKATLKKIAAPAAPQALKP